MLIPPEAIAATAGRSGRSATTSAGCARAPMAACTRSTRKPASSASRRAQSAKPIPTRSTIDPARHDLHQRRRSPPTTSRGGKARQRPSAGHRLAAASPTTPAKRPGRASEFALHRVSAKQCPSYSPQAEDAQGVPISRDRVRRPPRVAGAAGVRSARLDARRAGRRGDGFGDHRRRHRRGRRGAPRPDGDEAVLRLQLRRLLRRTGCRSTSAGAKLPKIFHVNWFRKGDDGKFLWPGFGDNLRVLEWMIKRVEGKAGAVETPIGALPKVDEINLDGVALSDEARARVVRFRSRWLARRVRQHRQLPRRIRPAHAAGAEGRAAADRGRAGLGDLTCMQASLPRREDVEASLAARDLPRALAMSAALLESDPDNAGYRALRATCTDGRRPVAAGGGVAGKLGKRSIRTLCRQGEARDLPRGVGRASGGSRDVRQGARRAAGRVSVAPGVRRIA